MEEMTNQRQVRFSFTVALCYYLEIRFYNFEKSVLIASDSEAIQTGDGLLR
jgi:hypothetical protein